MKPLHRFHLFSSVALLVLVALPCQAQGQQGSPASAPLVQTFAVTGSSLVMALPEKPYVMQGPDYERLEGQYDLSDGKKLTLSGSPHRMVAELDGLPRTQLVAASPQLLISRDRLMHLSFELAPNGVVREVTVTYVQPQTVRGQRRRGG